jgi:DNA repair protein RadA/Sms
VVACGEVGLTGEVRAVGQVPVRITEASRLGFRQCLIPKKNLKNMKVRENIEIVGVETIQEAVDVLFKKPLRKKTTTG